MREINKRKYMTGYDGVNKCDIDMGVFLMKEEYILQVYLMNGQVKYYKEMGSNGDITYTENIYEVKHFFNCDTAAKTFFDYYFDKDTIMSIIKVYKRQEVQ